MNLNRVLSLPVLAALIVACSAGAGSAGAPRATMDAGSDAGQLLNRADVGEAGTTSDARPLRPSDRIKTPEELMAHTGPAPSNLGEIEGVWVGEGGYLDNRARIGESTLLIAGRCDGVVFGTEVPIQITDAGGSDKRIVFLDDFKFEFATCEISRLKGAVILMTTRPGEVYTMGAPLYQLSQRVQRGYKQTNFNKIGD